MMGSSLVELGHTKVLAQAKLLSNSNEVQVDTGVLQINCQAVAHFGMPSAPTVQSLDGRAPSSNSTSRDQVAYLQGQLYTAMVPAIRNLQDYHKIVISVDITILQNDGALLTACCAAATLALCDAGVELYDLVTCGQVVVLKDIILADPTLEEEQEASSRLVLALCHNDVTFWRQSGVIPPEAMETCQEACRTLHLLLRNHLIQKINGHVTRKESQ
jgi:ribonuclease PH